MKGVGEIHCAEGYVRVNTEPHGAKGHIQISISNSGYTEGPPMTVEQAVALMALIDCALAVVIAEGVA